MLIYKYRQIEWIEAKGLSSLKIFWINPNIRILRFCVYVYVYVYATFLGYVLLIILSWQDLTDGIFLKFRLTCKLYIRMHNEFFQSNFRLYYTFLFLFFFTYFQLKKTKRISHMLYKCRHWCSLNRELFAAPELASSFFSTVTGSFYLWPTQSSTCAPAKVIWSFVSTRKRQSGFYIMVYSFTTG